MSLKYYWVWVVAIMVSAFAVAGWVKGPYQPLILVTLVLCALLLGILYVARFADALEPFNVDSSMPGDVVDPWAMQEVLMEASEQPMATSPALTNTSVLYGALIMEEAGETFAAMIKPLEMFAQVGSTYEDRLLGRDLVGHFHRAQFELNMIAKTIRQKLAGRHFHIELTPQEAKEIFDGTIDITVVNCGFALASGFDGSAGYAEVAGSNLSKRNPETGMIDKTPDGKWIKGVNYREPNLIRVMRETACQRGLQEVGYHPV